MTLCARAGCGRQLPARRTRPANYCSPACKTADYRQRRRLLTGLPITSLIWDARRVVAAWQALQGLAPDDPGYQAEAEMHEALAVLIGHPLLAGPQARGLISSSHPLPGARIGDDPAGQGGEAGISPEMECAA